MIVVGIETSVCQ